MKQKNTFSIFYDQNGVLNKTLSSKLVPSLYSTKQSCIQENQCCIHEHQSCKQNEEVEIAAIRCSCKGSWCEYCAPIHFAPKFIQRLTKLDWPYTRQIVLTTNRKLFKSGKEAYKYCQNRKLIPQLIHNLKRTKGVVIHDWLWNLEFHRDGYPHWHLFIHVDAMGKAGMIHFKNIKKYWNVGNVTEKHIESEFHWNNIIKYFSNSDPKQKKKGHQTYLPEWAMDEIRAIRRFGSMRIKKNKLDSVTKNENQTAKQTEKPQKKTRKRKSYREIWDQGFNSPSFS